MNHSASQPDRSPQRTRGRGAQINPANRFEDHHLEILPETIEESLRENPRGVQVRTETLAEGTRSIINRVDSPDLPFHWTINPYRGCEHGCIYCYARPTHELLGLSCGLDFETKIVAKREAAELLRRELASPRWKPEPIVMSGVTDPYQPIERELRITRGCLEVLEGARQPVSVITKNAMICRDIDLLQEMARHNVVTAALSVTTLDNDLARRMEPRASAPRERLEAVRELHSAGIPVMVMVAPIIPGLNDREIPAILKAVAEAGALSAGWTLLRLPHQVKAIFLDWLAREFPDRAKHIESLVRGMRGGALNQAQWGERFRGQGAIAEQIRQTFKVFRRRYGLDREIKPLDCTAFRRPSLNGQLDLFGGGDTGGDDHDGLFSNDL